ncbi:MAG TPA: MGMT family protein [Chthoniobacterales bacterium]|nr:MGMT family protein [Chthoniobacterales bacterium]
MAGAPARAGRLAHQYGQLSAAIGSPGASRAVGSAVGANPIAFIIPRHRVIPETGVVGNYRWDPIRKRAMIGWEISACSPLRAGEPYRIQANAA